MDRDNDKEGQTKRQTETNTAHTGGVSVIPYINSWKGAGGRLITHMILDVKNPAHICYPHQN